MTASTTKDSHSIGKGRDGWEAKSTIGLGVANRVLVISTHKSNGGVVTTNSVMTDNDGYLSCILFEDFSKRTMHKGVRCTEKTVTELHAQALAVSDLTMSEAAAFYAKKDRTEDVSALPACDANTRVELEGFSDPMHY